MGIRRIKNQNGFTLAEVLVAAGILAVIGTIMLSFFIQGSNLWQLITNQSDLRSAARNAINFMAQELRNATRTSSETPPNLSIPPEPNNSSIGFYLPGDLDGNGTIINAIGGTEWDEANLIQYQYIPGLRQLRRLEKGEQYIIANEAALVEFEDNSINPVLNNNELKVILTLNKVLPDTSTASVTLVSILKLRNQ